MNLRNEEVCQPVLSARHIRAIHVGAIFAQPEFNKINSQVRRPIDDKIERKLLKNYYFLNEITQTRE